MRAKEPSAINRRAGRSKGGVSTGCVAVSKPELQSTPTSLCGLSSRFLWLSGSMLGRMTLARPARKSRMYSGAEKIA